MRERAAEHHPQEERTRRAQVQEWALSLAPQPIEPDLYRRLP